MDLVWSVLEWGRAFCDMKVMVAASVIGGYVTTSLLLFKYPTLIHKKKELKFYCRHISHRGGAGERVENSMPAFENAIKQKTDMLEIDLHLTRDQEIVVSHDDNLFRTTGVNIKISETDYDGLPLLKSSLPIDYSGGKMCYGEKQEKIVLLEEVFKQFPDVAINIDIKMNSDILISKVNDLIKKYNREDITVWGNFSTTVTDKCYKLNPNIPVYFSAKRVILLILLTYNGLLPFVPLKESCFELIMPSALTRNPNFNPAREKLWRPWLLWLIEKLLMRKSLIEHLAKRGIQTYLWVLNEDEDFEKAFQLGATGIMTDYPTTLRRYLDRIEKEEQIH